MRAITVWETPGQRGDWAARVMMPLFESGVLAGVQSNPEPVRLCAATVDNRSGHPCSQREGTVLVSIAPEKRDDPPNRHSFSEPSRPGTSTGRP